MSPAKRLVVAALAVGVSGCFSLKSGNDVGMADMAIGGGDGGGCWDPTGFGGKGCYTCTPTTKEQLLNACTPSNCVAYDNTGLGITDAGLPALPELDFALAPANGDMTPAAMPDMAHSLPLCSSLSGGNVVYAEGSSAVQLFLGNIAQVLENASTPLSVIYQNQGSCTGVSAILGPTKMTGFAIYWDPNPGVDPSTSGARLPCKLDPGGTNVDIGFSDVFAGTCQSLPNGLDPSIKDTFGPVQMMNLVVPQNSVAMSISSEATYLVYGFGAQDHVVTPWNDRASILQRNGSSGTQNMIGSVVGLAATHWYGKQHGSTQPMIDDLTAAGSKGQDPANKAIGILSSDAYDPLRATLRNLAFQDFGQNCGFYPDSDVMSKDKANVRDGHYSIFGPLHMLAHVDKNGQPLSANASVVLNAITGTAVPSGVDIIDVYAKRSVIPQCAMKVTRDQDGGDFKPFKPTTSCACYYTERATGLMPPPGCNSCNSGSDCPPTTPNCNKFASQTKGYCEP